MPTFNFSRRRKMRAVILFDGAKAGPIRWEALHKYGRRMHTVGCIEWIISKLYSDYVLALELPFCSSEPLCSGCANLFSFQAHYADLEQIRSRLFSSTKVDFKPHIVSMCARSLRIEWFHSNRDENAIFRCICDSNCILFSDVERNLNENDRIGSCSAEKKNAFQFIHGPNLFIHHYHFIQREWN